jgi:hypothetical protein
VARNRHGFDQRVSDRDCLNWNDEEEACRKRKIKNDEGAPPHINHNRYFASSAWGRKTMRVPSAW